MKYYLAKTDNMVHCDSAFKGHPVIGVAEADNIADLKAEIEKRVRDGARFRDFYILENIEISMGVQIETVSEAIDTCDDIEDGQELGCCRDCRHWERKYEKCENPGQVAEYADHYMAPPTHGCGLWESEAK